MTKQSFLNVAKPLAITIAGSPLIGSPKTFSTGSSGWNANGKINVPLPNGELVKVQVSMNLIVAGSKDWVESETPAVAVAPPAPVVPVTAENIPV